MNNNSTNVNNLVVGLDIGTTKIATVVGLSRNAHVDGLYRRRNRISPPPPSVHFPYHAFIELLI